ncbi:MAG: hypothetical protein HY393_00835 [Candidatus Diapherotrites archaeon]|nr:hypothetical protein [Candidatus Diapherotrites archaeon]
MSKARRGLRALQKASHGDFKWLALFPAGRKVHRAALGVLAGRKRARLEKLAKAGMFSPEEVKPRVRSFVPRYRRITHKVIQRSLAKYERERMLEPREIQVFDRVDIPGGIVRMHEKTQKELLGLFHDSMKTMGRARALFDQSSLERSEHEKLTHVLTAQAYNRAFLRDYLAARGIGWQHDLVKVKGPRISEEALREFAYVYAVKGELLTPKTAEVIRAHYLEPLRRGRIKRHSFSTSHTFARETFFHNEEYKSLFNTNEERTKLRKYWRRLQNNGRSAEDVRAQVYDQAIRFHVRHLSELIKSRGVRDLNIQERISGLPVPEPRKQALRVEVVRMIRVGATKDQIKSWLNINVPFKPAARSPSVPQVTHAPRRVIVYAPEAGAVRAKAVDALAGLGMSKGYAERRMRALENRFGALSSAFFEGIIQGSASEIPGQESAQNRAEHVFDTARSLFYTRERGAGKGLARQEIRVQPPPREPERAPPVPQTLQELLARIQASSFVSVDMVTRLRKFAVARAKIHNGPERPFLKDAVKVLILVQLTRGAKSFRTEVQFTKETIPNSLRGYFSDALNELAREGFLEFYRHRGSRDYLRLRPEHEGLVQKFHGHAH